MINNLERRQINIEGDWSMNEIKRIDHIFEALSRLTGSDSIADLFNQQTTTLHHSGRSGRVGRTRRSHIFLDDQWTDWTLAHELGHRWNNAWERQPEHFLQKVIGAGRLEWIKYYLRRFEKWLEKHLKRLGVKKRIDWRHLWYSAGNAPPPCGVDRNFNASEDLAESFASILFPAQAKKRAREAAARTRDRFDHWDWGKIYENYEQTPRGKLIIQRLKEHVSSEKHV